MLKNQESECILKMSKHLLKLSHAFISIELRGLISARTLKGVHYCVQRTMQTETTIIEERLL